VDFCARARGTKWKICLVERSRIIHIEGESTGIRDVQRRRPAYWYASRRHYFVKHFGLRGLIAADVLWALGRLSLSLRRLLRLGHGGVQRDPDGFAYDLLWGDL